ncbi:putative immunity protein [Leifsonia sp. NPDC056824]|uniref:putative immunity protein n=1 Tax=Leifsonia sp. NPDC056824 TaxID=3345953 RepID=UPI0036CBF4D6
MWHDAGVPSPQTLSLADRRLVAAWAADCASRVLVLFEAEAPEDPRPRDAMPSVRTARVPSGQGCSRRARSGSPSGGFRRSCDPSRRA